MVKCYRKARAIFKPVDHSEFHLWGLPIPHSSCIESQSLTDSGMAVLPCGCRHGGNGEGWRGGGSGGTPDCVISGFYRAGSGLGPHRLPPGPFKFPPF